MRTGRRVVRNRYSLFGLQIDSDLTLPELFEAVPVLVEEIKKSKS
jgi:hypothetical protein